MLRRRLRERQIRNILATVMLSQGTAYARALMYWSDAKVAHEAAQKKVTQRYGQCGKGALMTVQSEG